MQKSLRPIAAIMLFFLLAFITTGCSGYNGHGNNPYTIQNGVKSSCNPDIFGNSCGNDYYEVTNGQTYHCTYWTGCDESNPVTPPVVTAQCVPNYAYDHLIDKGQSWEVVNQQQDQNNASSPVQAVFTSTTSKTVTVSDKLDVIGTLNITSPTPIGVITANVKAEINHEVTQVVNATIDNSTSVTIPPRETAYGNYGVRVQITSGHLYDTAKCEGNKSDWGTDITYVPIAAGWCVWTSTQPTCPSI